LLGLGIWRWCSDKEALKLLGMAGVPFVAFACCWCPWRSICVAPCRKNKQIRASNARRLGYHAKFVSCLPVLIVWAVRFGLRLDYMTTYAHCDAQLPQATAITATVVGGRGLVRGRMAGGWLADRMAAVV